MTLPESRHVFTPLSTYGKDLSEALMAHRNTPHLMTRGSTFNGRQ